MTKNLGKHLNRVESSMCTTCRVPGHMDVFEVALRWPCGHTRELPPLPKMIRAANRRPKS